MEKTVVCRDANHEQSMLNEVDIDFRIPRLPHSVVKQAESSRICELVKKIENHPDRHALQLDLQQNKAYNPFSAKSKKMIQDVGNVELFELFETDPKTQCKACLSYWSEGIIYCTCGHLLKETVADRSFIVYTLDLLSISEYVIKKGRPHGHRYGKAPENKEYYLAHNLKKRCIKREFTGIHHRFLRDHVFRETNARKQSRWRCRSKCDDLAEQNHTYRMSESEYFSLQATLSISPGNTTEPLRKRSDFNQALSTLNRLPRTWRKQTQAYALLEVPAMETGIKFFLHLVAMERILVVFSRNQRKSIKEDACKGLWSNDATRCLQNFGENLRRMAFTNSFYFVTDRSFTADGGLL